MMRTGIILLSLGGPGSPEDVPAYLYRFMNDRSIIDIPTPFRQALARLIVFRRSEKSKYRYALIRDKTSSNEWTVRRAKALEAALIATGGEYHVVPGFRASSPSIDEAVRALRERRAERVVLLPLFPQYSRATTGGCLDQALRALKIAEKKFGWYPEVRFVKGWADLTPYVSLLREYLLEAIRKVAMSGSVHVVFSAHSLPIKLIERGDTYLDETRKTVIAISDGLDVPWSLAFQSQGRMVDWLGPSVKDELKRIAEAGCTNVVICPVSFVDDHIETLWELDIDLARYAQAVGITSYFRVPMFNDDPRFIALLVRLTDINA